MSNKTQDLINLKRPDLHHPILKELKDRFSPRVFSDEKVKEKDLKSMFEAARWTPSARNLQPWYFYWAKVGSEGHKKLSSCLPLYNRWSEKAPVLILACYIDESPLGKNEYALYDLGAAVISLIYQATNLGYCARQVGSFDRKKAKKILNLPSGHKPFVLIPLGKLGDYSKASLPIKLLDSQKRERKADLARELK